MEMKEWADATLLLQPLATTLDTVHVVFITTRSSLLMCKCTDRSLENKASPQKTIRHSLNTSRAATRLHLRSCCNYRRVAKRAVRARFVYQVTFTLI
jgi:hypothetical protein